MASDRILKELYDKIAETADLQKETINQQQQMLTRIDSLQQKIGQAFQNNDDTSFKEEFVRYLFSMPAVTPTTEDTQAQQVGGDFVDEISSSTTTSPPAEDIFPDETDSTPQRSQQQTPEGDTINGYNNKIGEMNIGQSSNKLPREKNKSTELLGLVDWLSPFESTRSRSKKVLLQQSSNGNTDSHLASSSSFSVPSNRIGRNKAKATNSSKRKAASNVTRERKSREREEINTAANGGRPMIYISDTDDDYTTCNADNSSGSEECEEEESSDDNESREESSSFSSSSNSSGRKDTTATSSSSSSSSLSPQNEKDNVQFFSFLSSISRRKRAHSGDFLRGNKKKTPSSTTV